MSLLKAVFVDQLDVLWFALQFAGLTSADGWQQPLGIRQALFAPSQ